ncbi:flagellar biosynthesis protein FliP [Helicobacter pylori Hp P-13]|nr:flagellar biosynthesis protein FliP [Helicobacter pylori Hp P-13]
MLALICPLICPLMSADSALPSVNLSLNAPSDPKQLVTTLNVIALLTLLVLAPSLILVMTSFTRLIVVFSFLRTALGTQQTPPLKF